MFFEIVSLFPLFPGTNELDQINKIHNVLGTPRPELLSKMKRQSAHMDLNFPPKEGSGIEKLIPHVSAECVDLIAKLLAYNPDDRLSARQALRHPYFKELRDADKRMARSSVDGAPSHASIMPRAERSLVHRSNAGNAIGAAALPTIKDLVGQVLKFAFNCHQFAGGFDSEANSLFADLHAILAADA